MTTLDTIQTQLKTLDISVAEIFESTTRAGYTCFLFNADVSDEKLRELRETFKGDAVPCRNRLYVKVAANGEVADAPEEAAAGQDQEIAEIADTLRRPYTIKPKTLVHPLSSPEEREKSDAALEQLRNEHWQLVNDHVFGSDTNGQQPKLWHILYLEKYVETDPAPVQPQPTAEAKAEPPAKVHIPDAIIDPADEPEPEMEKLERTVTTARRKAAELWKAESNARIQAAVFAGMDAAAAYTARVTPQTPLFGKVISHV